MKNRDALFGFAVVAAIAVALFIKPIELSFDVALAAGFITLIIASYEKK